MKTISILIPAYNEEKSIKKCIESCIDQSEKLDEIIVVNDGSTDRTLEILKSFKNRIKIINLKKNTGNKSKAQEIGLNYIKTDLFITTDADTKLDRDFVRQIKNSFNRMPDHSAICGFVESENNNWITAVREINYLIGQTIYKKAQTYMGAMLVLPGCATGFNTADFKKVVKFDHDNITEDLDFTYKLKLNNKKIEFNNNAIVYTQDPNNLKSYFKQLDRWYSGGWCCLRKNFSILKKPNNALIISLIYIEGLILGAAFLLAPLLIFLNTMLFLMFLLLTFSTVIATSIYGIIRFKRYKLFLYIPHHYLLGIGEQIVFLYTFFKEIIFRKTKLVWFKPDRY